MPLVVHNVIMGTMFIELQGNVEGFNETTGDKIKIKFNTKTWRKPEFVSGTVEDKHGNVQIEISGAYTKELFLTHSNGNKESVWTIPDKPHEAIR